MNFLTGQFWAVGFQESRRCQDTSVMLSSHLSLQPWLLCLCCSWRDWLSLPAGCGCGLVGPWQSLLQTKSTQNFSSWVSYSAWEGSSLGFILGQVTHLMHWLIGRSTIRGLTYTNWTFWCCVPRVWWLLTFLRLASTSSDLTNLFSWIWSSPHVS